MVAYGIGKGGKGWQGCPAEIASPEPRRAHHRAAVRPGAASMDGGKRAWITYGGARPRPPRITRWMRQCRRGDGGRQRRPVERYRGSGGTMAGMSRVAARFYGVEGGA
jgi:hypothetical protein